MVTFLDIGLLGAVSSLFMIILVFVIMYGFLSWTKPFGDKNQGLYALIAFGFAIISMTSEGFITLIAYITPWFFTIIFIGFFILFVLMMFGLKQKDLVAGTTSELRTWVIIITVVLMLFGLGAAFGQTTREATTGPTTLTETTTPSTGEPGQIYYGDDYTTTTTTTRSSDPSSFGEDVTATLFHPKVLGMIVILLVGAFAMFLLTKGNI
ncbi:hypothetical protein KO361_03645 [Candidatus Woesearchaeota archaeon]|nr:hypothetical protein [Candidatus Woesearchaeota archaeon]